MRTKITGLALVLIASLVASCGNKGMSVGGGRVDATATDTGGIVGSGGLGSGGRRADGSIGGTDGPAASAIVGSCTVDTDCVAVLDYRAGFECYSPTVASVADLARDPCLVPWNSNNPKCPLVTPPNDCPGGPIPVGHSCIILSCQFAVCAGGTCALNADFSTPSRCAAMDAGAPPDCDALRATYFAALAAAQTCDPTQTPTGCFNAFYDSCGCPAAADLSSPRANALQCALDALQRAQCGFGNCGAPCPSGNSTPACASMPNLAGVTLGTCIVR